MINQIKEPNFNIISDDTKEYISIYLGGNNIFRTNYKNRKSTIINPSITDIRDSINYVLNIKSG